MVDQTLGFILANLQTEQFAIFEENNSGSKSDTYSINSEMEIGISESEKGVQILLGLTIIQQKKTQIKIEVASDFIIEDAAWNSFCSEEIIILPLDFMQHLTQISIGAIRGILHARTRNTAFNDFLLPLMNVSNLVVEDIHFSLDEEK